MYSLVMKKEIFNAFNDSAFAKFIFPLNVHSIADSLYEQGGIREIIDTYFSDIYVKKIDRDFFNLAKILFSEQYLLKHVEGSIAIIQYKCENGILLKNYGVN